MKCCAFVIGLLGAMLCGCGRSPPPEAAAPELSPGASVEAEARSRDEVKAAFDSYKSSILAKDGAAAVKLVSQRTLDEYQKYVDWSRLADRTKLKSLSTINKVQVLLMKHRIPLKDWDDLTGEKSFVYAVDHDWIGKAGTIALTVGEVQISGDRAVSTVYNDKKLSPQRFHFIRENGSWKLDLVQVMIDADQSLKAQLRKSGVEEDDAILSIIESISGQKPAESIWDPIAPP